MKNKTVINSSVLLLSALILISGCKKNDPVVQVPVGIVISLTGSFSPYGLVQKNGLTMAIDKINSQSSLTGVEFVPYFKDDKSSPDTCRKVFRELIDNEKVTIIVGPTSSNSAFSADTVAQNRKVPVVAISNTVAGITGMGNFIFRNSLPESAVIPNTVSLTHQKLGYTRVAIVYGDDDAYTLGAYQSFKTALEGTAGVTIVTTQIIHKGDTQFADLMNVVKLSDPQVIVLAALVNEASKLIVQGRQAGIPAGVRFIGGNSFNTSQLWQQAGVAAQGAICGSAWISSNSTAGNADFVSAFTTLYGSEPDQFAAQAYASLFIIADAAGRCSEVTSQNLRDALAQTVNLQTILGMFSFDANRDPVHAPVVQELVDGVFTLHK